MPNVGCKPLETFISKYVCACVWMCVLERIKMDAESETEVKQRQKDKSCVSVRSNVPLLLGAQTVLLVETLHVKSVVRMCEYVVPD